MLAYWFFLYDYVNGTISNLWSTIVPKKLFWKCSLVSFLDLTFCKRCLNNVYIILWTLPYLCLVVQFLMFRSSFSNQMNLISWITCICCCETYKLSLKSLKRSKTSPSTFSSIPRVFFSKIEDKQLRALPEKSSSEIFWWPESFTPSCMASLGCEAMNLVIKKYCEFAIFTPRRHKREKRNLEAG